VGPRRAPAAIGEVFGFRELPWTTERWSKAVKDTVRANGFGDCYIRPLLFLDGGGWNLNVDGGKPRLAIATWEWGNYLGEEALAKGIRANISSFTRHHVNVSMTKSKVVRQLRQQLPGQDRVGAPGLRGSHHARPAGLRGRMHRREHFHRPARQDHHPATAPVLEGITRHSIHTIAKAGLHFLEQPVSRDQLYLADEVFVCRHRRRSASA
jgi:branched-chain amino acid aminotransferase